MRPVITIMGTWGRADLWHRPGSPLRTWLESLGLTVFDFLWSGAAGGLEVLPTFVKPPVDPHTRFWEGGVGWIWAEAGEKLILACKAWGIDKDHPHLFSHSHAYQVVNRAAATGEIQFGNHISISGPIRADEQRVRRAALPFLGQRVQVYDPLITEDHMIQMGGWFSGRGKPEFLIPEPGGINIEAHFGHSGLLQDPAACAALGLGKYLA